MSATHERQPSSNGVVHENLPPTRVAVKHSNAQTDQHQVIEDLVRQLLVALGENPDRVGLLETPRRVADYYQAFINYNPGKIDTTFEAVTTNQMVVVSPMRVWSLCEHHLLPFWCDVSVGYIASDCVLGLSKFARIAHKHAHKLQLQERLVDDIANEVREVTRSPNVIVTARGEHLCMVMRGIETPAIMTSIRAMGVFENDIPRRQEFLSLIGR